MAGVNKACLINLSLTSKQPTSFPSPYSFRSKGT